MRHLLILLTVIITVNVNAKSLQQDHNKDGVDPKAARLYRDFNLVTYVENFKNIMAEYVSSEYRHLTYDEVEKVKTSLEEFLQNFAKDMKEILDNRTEGNHKYDAEQQKIEDGISDATFEEIKQRVRIEFPEIGEETANEIIYRLRKSLLGTRQKLDQIIEESKRAHIANSYE